jgi:hypothetical protein
MTNQGSGDVVIHHPRVPLTAAREATRSVFCLLLSPNDLDEQGVAGQLLDIAIATVLLRFDVLLSWGAARVGLHKKWTTSCLWESIHFLQCQQKV